MRRLLLSLALLLAPAAVLAQASPSPYTSATRYDAAGRVTGTISADPDTVGSGNPFIAVRNTYDGAGRLTKVETGTLSAWQSEAVAPSSWGGAFSVLRTLETQYDSVGHKIRDTLREGAAGTIRTVTQYSYDSVGRLECAAVRMNPAVYASLPASACTLGTQGSDGPDRIGRSVYDAAGERVQSRLGAGTAVEGAEATWAYNDDGEVTAVIDGEGNRAELRYDGFGRQDRWTFPSATRPASYNDATQASALSSAGSVNTSDYEGYTYDPNGNRTELRKRDGRRIDYAYDWLNRVTAKTYPDGGATAVYYAYDNRNLQLYARYSSVTGEGVTNSYDGFGRLASAASNMGGTSRTLTYAWDADGDRVEIKHPDGNYFGTVYDGLDRPFYMHSNWTAGIAYDYYDSAGEVTTSTRVGVEALYSYDALGRLGALIQGSAWGGSVVWTFARNPAGQIASETRDNDTYAWGGHYAVNRGYTTNGLNQYTAAGGASFGYDANGNLTSDGANAYTYDIENRMTGVTGARNASLAYDPLGRLWQVATATSTTRFLYDGDALVAEYNAAGTLLARHAHWPGTDVPMVSYAGATLSSPTQLLADVRGSIVTLADGSGALSGFNRYDEYGIPASTNVGRFQYTGQVWLSEIGMYYYKARIYSPTLGRFMQTDPVGYADQFNLYAYVGDDPVNRSDPTGTRCNDEGTECWSDDYNADRATIDVRHQPSTDAVVTGHRGEFQNPATRDLRSGAITEPRRVVVRNGDGTEALQRSRGSAGETGTGDRANIRVPSNATAIAHGHLPQADGTRTVEDTPSENRGWGDASSLGLSHPISTYTIAGDRVGVHDAPNGQVHFEMILGRMTREEMRHVQDSLNVEQQTLEESLRPPQ